MKAYASYVDWKRDQTSAHKRLITALERIVEGVAPDWIRSVKWGQGCWIDGDAPKVYIHTGPDHVQLGFYRGSKLKDPQSLLAGSGKFVRHVKLRKAADVDAKALAALVRQVLT
jgi:hypothetical protein